MTVDTHLVFFILGIMLADQTPQDVARVLITPDLSLMAVATLHVDMIKRFKEDRQTLGLNIGLIEVAASTGWILLFLYLLKPIAVKAVTLKSLLKAKPSVTETWSRSSSNQRMARVCTLDGRKICMAAIGLRR